METQTLNDAEDDGDVTAYRTRAKAMIDQIARQVKDALVEQQIDFDVFLVIPSSHSVVTFGTMSDPPDELWRKVSSVVSSIVREAVGLDRVRCREVACAATDSLVDHQPQASSICQPAPALEPVEAAQ